MSNLFTTRENFNQVNQLFSYGFTTDNECKDETMCKDAVKAAEDGKADGVCVNTLGGHECDCEDGYVHSEEEGLCVGKCRVVFILSTISPLL